jgi:hypothetical protein
MNTQDKARNLMRATGQTQRNRQQSMLERAANEVGLDNLKK